MLGNSTNNFNNLVGSLSRLNGGNATGRSDNVQQQSARASADFSNNISSANSGLESSFSGFEQQLGQRYSMSNNQTIMLLQMFIAVLGELINSVVTNSADNSGGNDAQSSAGQANNNQAGQQNVAGSATAGTAVNAGSSGTVNNAGQVDSVQATDSISTAAGSEAAQVHKSGGCPFMAMESEQNSDSGNAQAGNNQNVQPPAGVPVSQQPQSFATVQPVGNSTRPVEGTAGPSVNQPQSAPAEPVSNQNAQPAAAAEPASNPTLPAAEGAAGPDGNQPQSVAGAVGPTGNQSQPAPGAADNQLTQGDDVGAASVDKADSRDIDYSTLSKTERSDLGMSDRERAVVHLWGRQMLSAGEQNGGIYTNVLGADGTGSNWGNKEEVALIQELRAQEQEQFGTDTGWLLDEAYFEIMKDETGIDMSARYADRPVNESKGPVTISNDIEALEDSTGISGFEQGVLRLMGHDALMDGEFDGSVLAYTAGNANSLDSNKHSGGNAIDDTVQTLLAEDNSDDGVVNGSSILNHTVSTLDKLYA